MIGPLDLQILDVAGPELSASRLYEILSLRVEVFVVEQVCAYNETDGVDLASSTRHIWCEDDGGIASYLRLLGSQRAAGSDAAIRIGRVVTRADRRSSGIAGQLMGYVLDRYDAPFRLSAQTHLVKWYERFGFLAAGPAFVEDGIDHTPMRLEP